MENKIKGRKQIIELLEEHLVLAQERMKQIAIVHQTEREFSVGDWVFIKLQPYQQQFVAMRRDQKLSPKKLDR